MHLFNAIPENLHASIMFLYCTHKLISQFLSSYPSCVGLFGAQMSGTEEFIMLSCVLWTILSFPHVS